MTPDEHTISEEMIPVSGGHTLYVLRWGNPSAKTTIINLHGGPGGGTSDSHKRWYDPARYQVIFFDQRGAGKSIPLGKREHNTTNDLIQDISHIADHFKISHFSLRGGSWGCCLALAYAIAHPERVRALVLDGIFTGTKEEIDWLDSGKFRDFYPEAWDVFCQATPKEHRNNPTSYHAERALSSDAAAAKASGYLYETLEYSVLKLDDRTYPDNYDTFDPAGIQMELYYLKHGCFMPDHHIRDNAKVLTMPIYLLQGRYDMVCPPVTAYELSKVLPNCQLIWTIAGHKAERETWTAAQTIFAQL